jgi:predicted O-linked N-acetylglucosamine transferase (SPINDLY family)
LDIALDPFPFNGGTTSCDALWMGVPVITMEGDRPVGRSGLSILSNLGLNQYAAKTREQYIELAVALASDAEQLGNLRRTLRDRMLASPLMDGARFGKDFSDLLTRAWEDLSGG